MDETILNRAAGRTQTIPEPADHPVPGSLDNKTEPVTITITPHTFFDCRWKYCPIHNIKADPKYKPAVESTLRDETILHLDSDVVSVCAWCTQLNIVKMQRRETDVVIIYWVGKDLKIMRNGAMLTVSHAICCTCNERMRREP